MDRNVLVLCTANSCRSIIAEALINKELKGVKAYSSGSKPSAKVNPLAKELLINHNAWQDEYHSKELSSLEGIDFDLVVTVCDRAKESCPVFAGSVTRIHMGFEDPDGKGYEAFEKTYELMKRKLLPEIKKFTEIKNEKRCNKNEKRS